MLEAAVQEEAHEDSSVRESQGVQRGDGRMVHRPVRPNTWFAASRLPGSLKDSRYKRTADQQMDQNRVPSEPGTISSQMIELSPQHRPVRGALIVLGAIGITSALLLWIMHP